MGLFLSLLPLSVLALAMLLLPPLGALLSGQPLDQSLIFPLAQRAWDPLPPAPLVVAMLNGAIGLALVAVFWFARPRRPVPQSADAALKTAKVGSPPVRLLRWLAWGLLLMGTSLTLVGAGLAGLSHPLLILGLTLTLAGLVEWRTGTSLVTQRPGFFMVMFPVSAGLGWLFHWLNLFLQLWTYPGSAAEPGAAIPFALVRTLDYATLLPALLVLRQALSRWRPLLDWCSRASQWDSTGRPAGTEGGWLLILVASLGLAGARLWPDWIWPLTWLAPLLLVIGMQQVAGTASLLSGITHGDWSRLLIPALAALLLGLMVQAWNLWSGPTWVFHLPLVQIQTLFGLPLSGYAGILLLGPFGVWVADQLAQPWRSRPMGRERPFPIRVSIKP